MDEPFYIFLFDIIYIFIYLINVYSKLTKTIIAPIFVPQLKYSFPV